MEEKTTKQIEVIAQNTEDFETLDTRKVAMPGKLQGKSQDLDLIKQHSSSDEEGGKQLQLPGLRRAMSGTRATDAPRYSNQLEIQLTASTPQGRNRDFNGVKMG